MRTACLIATLIGIHAGHGGRCHAQHPNILLIVTDDHGCGDVSCYGAKDVRTPHIDRLGHEGMLFTAMRANATVCSPSRAALLTGRYPDRVGVPGVIRTQPDDSWGYFSPSVPTLANHLASAGYHTALVGKWHLGLGSPNTPNERGFHHFHGFLGDMMDSYTNHLRHGVNYLRLNEQTIETDGHATDLFADWSIAYLNERAANPKAPFFLYLAFTAPHFPIEPPAEWLETTRHRHPELSAARMANLALVEHLDQAIGRVLTRLDELGLAQNTVVVFTADNGGSLPHGQSNAPWRDGKQSHYDGGLRVPFLVRWPGRITAGSRSDYAGLIFDVFPTFLELAGITPPDPATIDAVSLMPTFEGRTMPDGRELYFVRREGGPGYGGKSYEALIRGEWKLMQNDPYHPPALYNLSHDPQETTNLATTAPQVVKDLSKSLARHIQRGGATPWQKP